MSTTPAAGEANYLELLSYLVEGTPRGEVLAGAIDRILSLTEAERAFLFRVRATGGFRVLMARNHEGESLERASRRVSHFAVRNMLETGGAWCVPDTRADRRYRTEDVLDGLRQPISIHVVPLRIDGRVAGGLYLDHRFREMPRDILESSEVRAWVALLNVAWLLRENAARSRWLARSRSAGTGPRPESSPVRVPAESPVPGGTRLPESGRGGGEPSEFHGLVSANPDMLDLFDTVRALRDSDLPVWIHGETGTGKGLLARAIHLASHRAERPFVQVSCGSIPESLLESQLLGHRRGAFTGAETDHPGLLVEADRGTFFLDELGDMSWAMQTKLLRVLEDGRVRPLGTNEVIAVDVRAIAATTDDPEDLVRTGRLRKDLYYRLRGAVLELPPLRERWEDIPLLAERFFARHGGGPEASRIRSEVLERWMAYSWPGNVRELENEVRRLAALGTRDVTLDAVSRVFREAGGDSFTAGRREGRSLAETLLAAERDAILEALRLAGGNKSRAAERLGITRKALYRRLARYTPAPNASGAIPSSLEASGTRLAASGGDREEDGA